MAPPPWLPGAERAASPARVRIVADDPLVVAALVSSLASAEGLCSVSEAEPADVVLWDLGLRAARQEPGASRPARAVRSQRLQAPLGQGEPPVVVLVADLQRASELYSAGAAGILARSASPAQLSAALIAARFGLRVLDAALAPRSLPEAGARVSWQRAAAPADEPASDESEWVALSEREQQVLALVAAGLSNKAIAARLALSIHTVKFHVAAILWKLGVDSRTAAVASALRRGLLRS
jgi:two-component system, NarL family, nitrate/nitrite response regulator NarL